MESGDRPDERTGLLHAAPESPRAERPGVLYTILSVSAVLLLNVSNQLCTAPQVAILEDIVCRQYYANLQPLGPPDVQNCKAEPVQSEVSFINGWRQVFDCLPAKVFPSRCFAY